MADPKLLVSSKIQEELLNTKEKRQQAIMQLTAVQAHPGWIILEKILKYNAEADAEVILSGEETPEREKEMRNERLMFLYLKLLPATLVKDLQVQDTQKEQNDDPYEPNNDPTIDNGQ